MPKKTRLMPFTGEEWLAAFQRGIIRIPLEHRILKGDIVSDSLREYEETKGIKRPTGWRLNIWKILLSTAFKEIDGFTPEKNTASVGFIVGIFQSALNSLANIDAKEIDELDCQLPEIDPELQNRADAYFEYLTKLCDRDNLEKLILKDRPEEIGAFFSSYASGMNALGSVNNAGKFKLKHNTDATVIYLILLIWGSLLQRQPSVKAVHMILQDMLGQETIPHSYESFRQLCNRIGYRCHSYTRRKKRINNQRKLR